MPLSAHVVDATTYLSYTMDGADSAGETGYGTPGRSASRVGTGTIPSVAGVLSNARRFSVGGTAFLRTAVAAYEPDGWGKAFAVEWRMKLRALDSGGDQPILFFIGGQTSTGNLFKVRADIQPVTGELLITTTSAVGVDTIIQTGHIVNIGSWKHYAIVSYASGAIQQFKLYVEGIEVFDSTSLVLGLNGGPAFVGAPWTYGPWVHIGANEAVDFMPDADFDDFAIRTDTRSAAQILADAQRGIYVTLTSPVAGVELVQGETQAVTWTDVGVPTIKLEYSTNNGATWTTIIASTDGTAGTYSWTVPAVSTTQGRVRLSDATDGYPFSTTGVFSIVPALPTAYQHQLRQLLPRGVLWTGALKSMLNRTLASLGDELARVVARGVVLVEESDPSTATETLPEWESAWGLPDATVTEIPATSALRRLAITQKVIKTGGQHAAYYIQIAAACGYTVTVTDGFSSTVFRTGIGRTGSRLYGVEWAHYWVMTITATAPVALSHAELERIITEISPAHTVVAFVYV